MSMLGRLLILKLDCVDSAAEDASCCAGLELRGQERVRAAEGVRCLVVVPDGECCRSKSTLLDQIVYSVAAGTKEGALELPELLRIYEILVGWTTSLQVVRKV